jgi:hypothetical protein
MVTAYSAGDVDNGTYEEISITTTSATIDTNYRLVGTRGSSGRVGCSISRIYSLNSSTPIYTVIKTDATQTAAWHKVITTYVRIA